MKHYPASRFPAPLQGLAISPPPRLPLIQRRSVWFAFGFFLAGALAGLIAGGTLP